MPIIGNITPARGRGTRKIFAETATITGTGTIATGLSTVEWAIASIVDSPTTLPNQVVEISSISAGNVSVVVTDQTITAGGEHAISATARSVCVIAIGY